MTGPNLPNVMMLPLRGQRDLHRGKWMVSYYFSLNKFILQLVANRLYKYSLKIEPLQQRGGIYGGILHGATSTGKERKKICSPNGCVMIAFSTVSFSYYLKP
jgi:hypothetical protein